MTRTLVLFFFVVPACGSLFCNAADFVTKIKEGDIQLDIRFRLEAVDQDPFSDDALASTIRTRLGYRSGSFYGWKFLLEFENTTVAGEERYNSTTNGITTRPVIADPEDTEVNQIHLAYDGGGKNQFIFGRQRLIFDNARFIGNVGWRQNEQTFDAAAWKYSGLKNTMVSVLYLDNVNRVFGGGHPAGDFRLNALVAHAHITKLPVGDLSVFAHFFENESIASSSHKNFGFRLTGAWLKRGDLQFTHDLSIADQSAYKNGVDTIDARYYAIGIGPKWGAFDVKLNYEVLGGDGTHGFFTPFATLHAFNGWADKFLSTPSVGLVDTYLTAAWQSGDWKLMAVFHDFQSDEGSRDFGSELDCSATKAINKHISLGLKFADFNADQWDRDTTKIWAWCQSKW